MPTAVFAVFALLAVAGTYLVVRHTRGRAVATAAALVVLVLFGALFWWIDLLLSAA
jgi:amino acid permease